MKILAIDTSTEACSAALMIDDQITERFAVAPREHAALILGMVDELLVEAGLKLQSVDRLAFGRGPGSFTGVRIGTSVTQGLALAAERPVVAVSTLAALAQGALRERGEARVLAALDARMGEVYWGAYVARDGVMELQGGECVVPPAQMPAIEGSGWFGSGSGWAVYADLLRAGCGGQVRAHDGGIHPQARDIALLAAHGRAVPAEEALPVYLRDRVVQERSS